MKAIDRVIVIDDDPTNNTICEIVLKNTMPDAAVLTFENPIKALEFFTNSEKEKGMQTVVFLDINMPEMSGWELLEELNARSILASENIQVYILSSSINMDDKEKALLDPNIIEFLEKPMTLGMVRRVFGLTS